MKILNARYPKLEDIPTEYQKLFEKKGDEYVLMDDAIDGAAALLNPGLEANRSRIHDEKERELRRANDAENRAREAERKLDQVAKNPDSVLTSEDVKTWERIKKLGDIKEIEKRFTEFPKLEQSVRSSDTEKILGKVRSVLNLPETAIEALKDTLENAKYGEGLEIKFKRTEVQKSDGSKETVDVPYFNKKTKTGENTFQESEHEIGKYAQENFPAYVVSAMSASANGNQSQQNANTQNANNNNGLNFNTPILGNPNQGLQLPILGSATGSQTGGGMNNADAMKIAEQQNQARDTRQSPFAVSAPLNNGAPANSNGAS